MARGRAGLPAEIPCRLNIHQFSIHFNTRGEKNSPSLSLPCPRATGPPGGETRPQTRAKSANLAAGVPCRLTVAGQNGTIILLYLGERSPVCAAPRGGRRFLFDGHHGQGPCGFLIERKKGRERAASRRDSAGTGWRRGETRSGACAAVCLSRPDVTFFAASIPKEHQNENRKTPLQ